MELNRQEVHQRLGEEEKKAGLGSGRSRVLTVLVGAPSKPTGNSEDRLTFEAVSTWNKGTGRHSIADTVHLDS